LTEIVPLPASVTLKNVWSTAKTAVAAPDTLSEMPG